MSGSTIVEGDDGTPLKTTFVACGVRESDVTAVQRTTVQIPILTPDGVEWELAEVCGVPDPTV